MKKKKLLNKSLLYFYCIFTFSRSFSIIFVPKKMAVQKIVLYKLYFSLGKRSKTRLNPDHQKKQLKLFSRMGIATRWAC